MAVVSDALISPRPYKDSWRVRRAIEYIQEQRGKQFAPEVVDAFITLAEDGTMQIIVGSMPEFHAEPSWKTDAS